MPDLADAYLAWCAHHDTPSNTIASRRRTLRSLQGAGTATREDVEAWWDARAHLSTGTRSNDLANLRSFYKWCRRWEHRDDDPTLRVDAPKVPKGMPRALGRADLRKLLDALPDDLGRAVALGAYAGLRVSEAAALRWDDVDVEARMMLVRDSKGGKSRRVPIGPVLLDRLLPDTGGPVIPGATPASLQRRVNRAMRAAGVAATFHQLRHRYGTLAYQESRDLLAVGRLMGHSSPVTTAIYAAPDDAVSLQIVAAVER